MTTTTLHRKATAPVELKAVDGQPGVFEAVVSVFGNVDLTGERVQRGAFTRSLDEWAASGDPIPVIFSHRWDDIAAHVGVVTEAAELAPGDARLPESLKANGGLWVRMALDVDDPSAPFAARLATLMARRSVREFSFAFDVAPNGSRAASDGVVDLTDLNLFEVGPCLKGMNPDTALLARKARETLATALAAGVDIDQALAEAELVGLLDAKAIDPPAELEVEAKTVGRPTGSLEATLLDPLMAALTTWALERYADDLFAVHLDGTFPDEGRAIVVTERWEDPYGEGPTWELHYATGEDGTISVGAAQEVDPVITFEPKRRTGHFKRRPSAEVEATAPADAALRAELAALELEL